MAKVIRITDGTTIVFHRRRDGDLDMHVHTEREADAQHLDAHDRESRTPVDDSDSDAA